MYPAKLDPRSKNNGLAALLELLVRKFLAGQQQVARPHEQFLKPKLVAHRRVLVGVDEDRRRPVPFLLLHRKPNSDVVVIWSAV